jgi:hypothetical protein
LLGSTEAKNYLQIFLASLKAGKINNPDQKVINVLYHYHPYNLIVAAHSVENSCALYEEAKRWPGTSTKAIIKSNLGLSVNGNLHPHAPGPLLIGSQGRIPVILKIDTTKCESLLYKAMFGNESKDYMDENYLVYCEVIDFEVDEEACAEMKFRKGKFNALKMERFVDVLRKHVAVSSSLELLKGAQMIEKAINAIHSKGFVHMDVKGDNIFIRPNGDWLLGDYGSCVKAGDQITSTTKKLYPLSLMLKPADPKYDWYMLVTCLAMELIKDDKVIVDTLFDPSTLIVDNNRLTSFIETIECNELKTFMIKYHRIGQP